MGDNIIFENIFDKINMSADNINSYFSNLDYYNTNTYDIFSKLPKYNIIIYIFIVFLIFNFIGRLNIRLNEILIFFVSVLVIYLLMNKDYSQFIQYTDKKKLQLEYLNKLIFNGKDWIYGYKTSYQSETRYFDNVSFLYLDPVIVEFFYNMRDFSHYNISSYVNAVKHANNVIGMDFKSSFGEDRKYLNYQDLILEVKKCLNEFNSVIYNLPSAILTYEQFNKSMKVLHQLLNQHVTNMGARIKNDNTLKENNKDITVDGYMPNDFYDDYFIIHADDTKTRDYISTYNMY